MWQWPWMLASLSLSFSALIGIHFSEKASLFYSAAYAESIHLSSSIDSNTSALFERGQNAFQSKKYEQAITPLKEIVEHHPGFPQLFEVKRLLGKSLLALKNPQEALPYLKEIVETTPLTHPQAVLIRLDLGEAYLQNQQNQLAYLTALEIEKLQNHPHFSPEEKVRGLLIKGISTLRTEQKEKREELTQLILSSIEGQSPSISDSLKTQVQTFKLEFKLHSCSRFFMEKNLNEQQILDQYDRQGLCLLEAFNLYPTLFKTSDPALLAHATGLLKKAFLDYEIRAQSPPQTAQAKGRSQLQQLKEQAELKDLLLTTRSKRFIEASNTLKLWRRTSPQNLNPYIHELLSALEKNKKG